MLDRRSPCVPVQGFGLRWRPPPAAIAASLLVLAGLAGCTGSGASSHHTGATGVATSTQPAAFTPGQLRDALLTRVNGAGPAAAADDGSYASLPEVKSAARSASAVSVTPKACARAVALVGAASAGTAAEAGTGSPGVSIPALNFGGAPAATVSFRVGQNGVSEILAAPADSQAAAALGQPLPTGCAHYSATSDGRKFLYAVQQEPVSGIGKQARVMSVTTTGNPSGDVWSVIYRGNGFVGAITVVGPNASEAAVQELAEQAYAFAAQSLS